MAEIVDTLINILCQQGTSSKCSQFVFTYPDVTQQIVWLVFFPSVFLLLFIIFIANGVAKEPAVKYKTLVAIAIYVFIVFQGWYHYFLTLSKYWFIGVIILGGIYVVIHKMGAAGRGNEGGGGRSRGLSRIKEDITGKLYRKYVSGETKDTVHHIEMELRNLENIKRDIDRADPGKDVTRLREVFTQFLERLETHLGELRKEEAVGGIVVLGKDYKRLHERFNNLTRDIRRRLSKKGA